MRSSVVIDVSYVILLFYFIVARHALRCSVLSVVDCRWLVVDGCDFSYVLIKLINIKQM